MRQFQRRHVETVLRLLRLEKPLIVAVIGPRQTGKTTIVRDVLRQAGVRGWYVAADEPTAEPTETANPRSRTGSVPARPELTLADTSRLVEVWEAARRKARASDDGFVLALDEIQRVPNWSPFVKGLWDRDRAEGVPLRVIVSGSAPWSLLTGIHESLAGRFMPVQVRQWSLDEMATAFDYTLNDYLFFGGYPGAAQLRNDVGLWREYVAETIVRPAISQDIVALVRVAKPALMRRLIALASSYSGQILSYNKMLGQLQERGNTTTLARYLDLLSDAGLVAGLPKYTDKPHLGKASSPKLNVLDTALMTAPSAYTLAEATADRTMWGRITESVVGVHLWNTRPPGAALGYWRDRAGLEVDFVLSRGPHVVGIEVKSSTRRQPSSTPGLESFKERFPGARTLLVGRGDVPLNEFLAEPASHWLEEP